MDAAAFRLVPILDWRVTGPVAILSNIEENHLPPGNFYRPAFAEFTLIIN